MDEGYSELEAELLKQWSEGTQAGTQTGPTGEQDAAQGEIQGEHAIVGYCVDIESRARLKSAIAQYDRTAVREGNIHDAVRDHEGGVRAGCLIVDTDNCSYVGGELAELSAYCERGTEVIVVGSDPTSRTAREAYQAGAAEYLAKPLDSTAIAEAVERVQTGAQTHGKIVAVLGTGGSGATTATIGLGLAAAQAGRYINVIDLDRMFPAACYGLGVTPLNGMSEIIEGQDRPATRLDRGTVGRICTKRGDRLQACGYRYRRMMYPEARVEGVSSLALTLSSEAHMVLIDGIEARQADQLVGFVDRYVLVVEESSEGVARGERMLESLPGYPPGDVILNQCRERKVGRKERIEIDGFGERAGVGTTMDYVREVADRATTGWQGGIPARLEGTLRRGLSRIEGRNGD